MFGKEDSGMSESSESDAKLSVLEELRDLATKLMGDKMPKDHKEEGLQVSVAAPDEKSLAEGLGLAEEMMPSMSSNKHEDHDMELEEIEQQIKELEELRRTKLGISE